METKKDVQFALEEPKKDGDGDNDSIASSNFSVDDDEDDEPVIDDTQLSCLSYQPLNLDHLRKLNDKETVKQLIQAYERTRGFQHNIPDEIRKKLYKPLVITGPSGVGKRALILHLNSKYPGLFAHCVSHTTRQRRSDEVDGVDYRFVSKTEFDRLYKRGEFIEYVKRDNSHQYGLGKWQIQKFINQKKIPLLELNIEGTKNFVAEYPQSNTMFLFPPSLETLQRRLIAREAENARTIQTRIKNSREEMDKVLKDDDQAKLIGYRLVNKDEEVSKTVVERIIEGLYYRELEAKPLMVQANQQFDRNQALEKVEILKKKFNQEYQDRISKLEEKFELDDEFLQELQELKQCLPDTQAAFQRFRDTTQGDLFKQLPELADLEKLIQKLAKRIQKIDQLAQDRIQKLRDQLTLPEQNHRKLLKYEETMIPSKFTNFHKCIKTVKFANSHEKNGDITLVLSFDDFETDKFIMRQNKRISTKFVRDWLNFLIPRVQKVSLESKHSICKIQFLDEHECEQAFLALQRKVRGPVQTSRFGAVCKSWLETILAGFGK